MRFHNMTFCCCHNCYWSLTQLVAYYYYLLLSFIVKNKKRKNQLRALLFVYISRIFCVQVRFWPWCHSICYVCKFVCHIKITFAGIRTLGWTLGPIFWGFFGLWKLKQLLYYKLRILPY